MGISFDQFKKYADKNKKYLDDKTSILPIKETTYVMQDAVPSSNFSDEYSNVYLFDSVVFPNTEEVKKLYCEVTYIDNNIETTKNVELEYNDTKPLLNESKMENYYFTDEINNFGIYFYSHCFDENNNQIEKPNLMVILDAENYIFAEVKKATIWYVICSNLFKDEYIEGLNYSKILHVPNELINISYGYNKALTFEEYINLKKNSVNWYNGDINLYNDAPYQTEAPDNTFKHINITNGLMINTKKPLLGKGIKIENYNYTQTYYIYYERSADVIIEIVDSNGKIIDTISNYEYDTPVYGLKQTYLGAYSIDKNLDAYIIFSVKEGSTSTTNIVNNLRVVTMGTEILGYDDIENKIDKSEIPTKVSQLENDSNYLISIPAEYITETELNNKGYLTEHQSLKGLATENYVNNRFLNIDIASTSWVQNSGGLYELSYTHNLATENISVQVYNTDSKYEMFVDTQIVDANNIKITSDENPNCVIRIVKF